MSRDTQFLVYTHPHTHTHTHTHTIMSTYGSCTCTLSVYMYIRTYNVLNTQLINVVHVHTVHVYVYAHHRGEKPGLTFICAITAEPKTYGCNPMPTTTTTTTTTSVTTSITGLEAVPEEARDFMFAPRDVTPWHFQGKEDLHGLNYRGMEESRVLAGRETRKAVYGMRGEVRGGGGNVVFFKMNVLP